MMQSTGEPTCNCQRGFIGPQCETADPLVRSGSGGGLSQTVWIPLLVIGLCVVVGAIIALVVVVLTRQGRKKRTEEMRSELIQKAAKEGI